MEMAAVGRPSVKSLDSLSSLEELERMQEEAMGRWVFAEEESAARQATEELFGETLGPLVT
jgi:hypothetical protein